MSFRLFLRGFIGALLVFAVSTYFITQSLWTTFIQTLIVAILLQIGYFAAAVFLVWRSPGQQKGGETAPTGDATQGSPQEDLPAGQVVERLPGVPSSRHP